MNPAGLERAAGALHAARSAIASTGAGISVESGIPDFRSAGGLWSRYNPDEYASIEAFLENPHKVWRMWRELHEQVSGCTPNPAHLALARLESAGRLKAVITQNVDNLHQDAGSTRVIEYHGNARHVVCLECAHRQRLTPEHYQRGTPHCPCGGLLKPHVVMFGEMIPQRAMLSAHALALNADVVLVVGTSAQVYPAASLPLSAKERGALIIECNVEETELSASVTDIFLKGPAGSILPKLAEAALAL